LTTSTFPAECFPDRTDVQCLHRWQKVLNPELVKGPWSKEVSTLFDFFYFGFISITIDEAIDDPTFLGQKGICCCSFGIS